MLALRLFDVGHHHHRFLKFLDGRLHLLAAHGLARYGSASCQRSAGAAKLSGVPALRALS
jgi:hypothetical protein